MITQVLPLTETHTPADEAEVAAAVREARGTGTPIYPIGGGTMLDYGVRPTRPGIGLSLAELNGVVDYPAADMTITVEAGITMAALEGQLAGRRQRLPIDVRRADRATLGGVIAANVSGPRRYAQGTIRDYVIGLRAVDGTAAAFSAGGRVVKNAAGYNLCRLMIGSLGTLGLITQVTLMVRPLPETSALLGCDLDDFHTAERLLNGLVHTKTLPAAIEVVAGPARDGNPVLGPILESCVARLLVGFEGSEAEVEWMVGQLRREWLESGMSAPISVPAGQAGLMWDWLRDFRPQVKICVRPGGTVAVIERLRQMDANCSIQSHAGNGVIEVAFPARSPEKLTAVLREKLRPMVSAAGGRMVVLSTPAGVELTPYDVWGPPGDAAAVMRAIKDRFDPDGLLNPGRFTYESR